MPMPSWGVVFGLQVYEEFTILAFHRTQSPQLEEASLKPSKTPSSAWEFLKPNEFYGRCKETQMDSESVKARQGGMGAARDYFVDMDNAVREYPDLAGASSTIVPLGKQISSIEKSTFWSGAALFDVPKGVDVEIPLLAYFRHNAQNWGY
jgi:Fe-S cluster assembly scaffold protein SufB